MQNGATWAKWVTYLRQAEIRRWNYYIYFTVKHRVTFPHCKQSYLVQKDLCTSPFSWLIHGQVYWLHVAFSLCKWTLLETLDQLCIWRSPWTWLLLHQDEEDDKDIDVLLKTFFIFRNKKEIFMSKIFFLNKYRSRLSATSNILSFEWAPLIEDFWYMKPYFLFVYGYKVFG